MAKFKPGQEINTHLRLHQSKRHGMALEIIGSQSFLDKLFNRRRVKIQAAIQESLVWAYENSGGVASTFLASEGVDFENNFLFASQLAGYGIVNDCLAADPKGGIPSEVHDQCMSLINQGRFFETRRKYERKKQVI